MSTNNIADGQTVSLDQMSDLIARSPAGVYGFVVSQKVYDELRRTVPEGFSGGNSFANVPIVVDPDLAEATCDVAFTRKGWRDRLRQIKEPR